jgi:glycosyltransferase involved in cell wall biosynthesis
MLPSFTVILPTRNHAQYLPGCLDALFAQSLKPETLIVVDDASTDGTSGIVAHYMARHDLSMMQYTKNEKNMGVNAIVNGVVAEVETPYVFFTADDDLILPTFFEKSLTLLAQHPEAAFCCTRSYRLVQGAGLTRESSAADLDQLPRYYDPEECALLIRNRKRLIVEGNTVLWKREAFVSVGGYQPELKWYSDWLAILAGAFTFGMVHVPELLAINRLSATSYSGVGMRDPAQQKEVVRGLYRSVAAQPAEVRRRFEHSQVLSFFGPEALYQ